MEKYLIYGSNFAPYFCQVGNTPEITMVDSREAAVEHLAKRVLSDIKEAYKEELLDELMTSDDEEALWEYMNGEGSSDNEYSVIDGYTEASILKYNDTSYLAEHNDGGDDGCSYDLGIAKQEFTVDDSGNVTVTLSTETDITVREVIDAVQKMYLAGK